MAAIVVWMVGMMILVRVLPTTVLIRAVYVLIGSFAVLSLGWFPWFAFRYKRLRNHLAANPDACLNCLYETVDPTTLICPECAHLSDRGSLNSIWSQSIKSRAPRSAAGDTEHEPAIVGGVPKLARRFFFRWISIVFLSTMFVIALIPAASLVGPLPGPLWVVTAVPLVFTALVILMRVRFNRLRRALRSNQLACLNCGYATIHPRTRVCPECANETDRDSLNESWRTAIARDEPQGQNQSGAAPQGTAPE